MVDAFIEPQAVSAQKIGINISKPFFFFFVHLFGVSICTQHAV